MGSIMRSARITSKNYGRYRTAPTTGESYVFEASQLIPAKDGTWLMVDYVELSDDALWYVTEGV